MNTYDKIKAVLLHPRATLRKFIGQQVRAEVEAYLPYSPTLRELLITSQSDLNAQVQSLENQLQETRFDIPHIADYRCLTLLERPVIFADDHDLLFECGDLGSYLQWVRWGETLDDPRFVRYVEQVVKPGHTVFDVGANIGGMSLLAGQLAGEQGRVYAFEPGPQAYDYLVRNIRRNKLEGVITAMNKAVYSAPGEMELSLYSDDLSLSGWSTLGHYEVAGHAPVKTVAVETVTLDDFCAAAAVTHIDLLKIDVEGLEIEVLRGANRLLAQGAIDRLVFEISQEPLAGTGYSVDDILDLLQSRGYTVYQLTETGDLAPVTPEVIRTTAFANYVAVYEGGRTNP